MSERTAAFERGYDAGNYASAYDTNDVKEAWDTYGLGLGIDTYEGFVIGFFSSYELGELPEERRGEVASLRDVYGEE
jgi:hypothetical protein